MSDEAFIRPFPALTSAQRYHFDIYGYVVIENTLTESETEALFEALHSLKKELLATGDPANKPVRGAFMDGDSAHHGFGHIIEAMPAFLDYYAHPRLVGMAEEVVGGNVRLSEAEAVINSRNPEKPAEEEPKYGFHRGTKPGFGTHTGNGLFHCNFVKTLANLTELGPNDGGTVVIAGSHKIDAPEEDVIALAYEDRSLIHQVVAPAGSTLLFAESLIHATGQIRSDRERTIIIGAYAPTMFQARNAYQPSQAFIDGLPDHLKPLMSGSHSWENWKERHRSLGAVVGS
jgi:hypothetical protein